ncbi:MAG: antitoxin [Verrucomicrobiota bacterium]
MIKTQVQLPDELYYKAKAIADQREWSLAEVVRRGIEYMALAYPVKASAKPWALPVLKSGDFRPNFDQLDLKALSASDELREDPS